MVYVTQSSVFNVSLYFSLQSLLSFTLYFYVVTKISYFIIFADIKDTNPLQCIGILPGLTSYEDSSDSASSDSEYEAREAKFDLLGRKVCQKMETLSSNQ